MKPSLQILAGRRVQLGVCALAVLGATIAARPPQDDTGADGVRELLQSWRDVRQQISKEKQDWALGQELMRSRIELLESEIESAREKVAGVEADIAKLEAERVAVDAAKASLQSAADELATLLVGLEERMTRVVAQLPAPLQEKLISISQSLPKDPATADKSKLGARFLTVVGLLNEINKFNRDIRVESEVRKLANGSSVEVTTVYIGLGQAFYASATGEVTGFGAPKADGWEWTLANEHAPEILRAIKILSKQDDADFVNLPVRIQ